MPTHSILLLSCVVKLSVVFVDEGVLLLLLLLLLLPCCVVACCVVVLLASACVVAVCAGVEAKEQWVVATGLCAVRL